MEKDIYKCLEDVSTKNDLVQFIYALVDDLRSNRESWENRELDLYLVTLATWIEDMDRYRLHKGLPINEKPSWRIFAEILHAGKIYE